MSNQSTENNRLPVAPLKIAALESCRDLAEKVNAHLVRMRASGEEETEERRRSLHYRGYDADSYLLSINCPRFGTGEGKGVINESVRGADLFVMVDVTNYSLTYKVDGNENHMSPDDHFQDLKRIIAAGGAAAHRVNVIMPFLYESRVLHRDGRESLDCSLALHELVNMGVDNILTFDAHEPRVQNAIPLKGFETVQPIYQFIKALLQTEPELKVDSEHMMIISPDAGGMGRAIYFANMMGLDVGMFYKRRDYTRLVGGRNPVLAHEFLGTDVTGKDVIVVDDMISSGETVQEVARELKRRGAKKVFVCATFGLFTNGLARFDRYYEEGLIDKIFTTNLVYQSPELLSRPYYVSVEMSKYIALLIDSLNHDTSVSELLQPHERIHRALTKHRAAQERN